MSTITLELPFPPTVNTYWRHLANGRHLISSRGREYKATVGRCVMLARSKHLAPLAAISGPLALAIVAHAPDARQRDLDNLLKATLDALASAGVYRDDSQIHDLRIAWGDKRKGGGIVVTVVTQPESGK